MHFYLQDGNYNVVALVDAAGGLAAQYAYEPYGLLAVVDLDPNAPVNRLGHQGLFFERFYGPFGGPPAPPLSAPALVAADPAAGVPAGLYHNRNRWYSPDLGRFVQRDMNETALPVLAVLAMNGAALDAFLSGLDPHGQFSDGANLYLYVGANPVNRRDARGLYYDPFEDVDGVLAGIVGENIAAVASAKSFLGQSMNIALMAGRLAFAFVPGSDALMLSLALMRGDDVDWTDFLGAGLDLMGPIGKVAGAVVGTASAYKLGVRTVKNLQRSGRGLFGRVGGLCFAAGTLVVMADGTMTPIERIRSGDRVLSDIAPDRPGGLEPGLVTGTSSRRCEETLRIELSVEDHRLCVQVTAEHPFYLPESNAFVPARDLQSGQRLLDCHGRDVRVVKTEVCAHSPPILVYNLAVSEAENYFVAARSGAATVLVHNGCHFPLISKIDKDWFQKGCHVKVKGIEVSVLPGTNGGFVVKPTFSSQARDAGAAIKVVENLVAGNEFFRRGLHSAVTRAVDFARGQGRHDKAFEYMMLAKALERLGI